MTLLPENRLARLLLVSGLVLTVAVLVAGLVFGRWLVPIILSLLVLLIELVVALLRNLVSSEREERLGRGLEAGAPTPGAPAGDLREEFRRWLDALKRSRLGRDGLGALPWLLVVGPPGAGKSALLRASGLELPAEFAHVARGGATRGCDWWLTNEAVLFDTAGRYATSEDAADRGEWRQLLRWISRARTRQTVNGVLLVLSAPELLSSSPGQLEEQARALRRRLNEITDLLRVDPPVYVVVSQLDRVEGFADWVAGLPPSRLAECLGFTNNERRFADAGDLTARALEDLRERVDTTIAELAIRAPQADSRRRVLGLPQELEALSGALASLLRGTFAPSVYQETPFLRGVYLCSAEQGGPSASALLSRLGADWARSQQAAAPGGWFLRDLFREVVIGDRDLAIPQSSLGPRGRRAIWATGAALCAAAVAAWSIAAYRIHDHQSQLVDRARRVNDAPSSLEAIDRLRRSIARSDSVTLLGRLGLGPALERARGQAGEVFLWAFGTYFEEEAKTRLRGDVKKLDASAFEALAELALDIRWLLERAGGSAAQRPGLVDYARRIGRNETDRLAFAECYDDFVRWLPPNEIERRLEVERRTLASASGTLLSIDYLERWSGSDPARRPPLSYTDLGLPAPGPNVRDAVSAAYTRATWESMVRGLLDGVEQTKGAPESSIRRFAASYASAHDAAWRRFLLNAPTPPRADPRVKDSPYHTLLRRVRDEMRAEIAREGSRPAWVGMLEEVLREEPLAPPAGGEEGEVEEQPPWTRYQLALEEVAKDVELAQANPADALLLTVQVAKGDASSFHRALEVVRSVLPPGDAELRRKLAGILEAPVLGGLRVVVGAAMGALDREWRSMIAGPFGRSLSEVQLAELYDGSSGALRQFEETWLDPFLRAGVSRPLLRDVELPLGPRFLEWLDSAHRMQQTLAGEGEIAVRLTGVPSRVLSGGVLEKRRVLQVDCADRLLSLEYRPHRSHTIPWTPSCTTVKLRVTVLSDGVERELPVRTWRGPLALPEFFRSAHGRDGRSYVWRVRDPDRGIELAVPYELRSGRAILGVAHSAPPDSVGS